MIVASQHMINRCLLDAEEPLNSMGTPTDAMVGAGDGAASPVSQKGAKALNCWDMQRLLSSSPRSPTISLTLSLHRR
jgi:hypothetical protein